MDYTNIIFVMFASAAIGGGLGAYLASVPFWKGALSSLIAVLLQIIIALFFGIDNLIIHFIIYLVMLGLVGGRLMMGLSGRALISIALGTLIAPTLAFILMDIGVQTTR